MEKEKRGKVTDFLINNQSAIMIGIPIVLIVSYFLVKKIKNQ